MAWKQNKQGEIVISGFEQGIADSPELGLGDIRGANITSVPGEISVSPSTAASLIPPTGQTGIAFTEASNVLTVASTAGYYDGMAIELDTVIPTSVINVLAVGGGGGGGFTGLSSSVQYSGGGGGGGQVNYQTGIAVSEQAYSVIVGIGGAAGSTRNTPGNNGNDSSISGTDITTITAIGGGGGGSGGTGGEATSGASGGGAAGNGNSTSTVPGASGTAGNAGGSSTNIAGPNNGPNGAGGGGGAGSAGSNGSATSAPLAATGGNGGNGSSNSISGSSVTYSGGGGGGAYTNAGSTVQGTGGTGGGGNAGSAGTPNTGGGGGGFAGGGSGIVIISYITGALTATGGTITTSGSNTIHTFTTTGTSSFTVTAVNPIAGNTYYVGNLSGNTFKLYNDPALTSLVTFASTASGTYDIPSFGNPVWQTNYSYYASSTSNPIYATFVLDDSGNCWYLNQQSTTGTGGTVAAFSLQYTGNTGHSTSGTNADFGIVAWKNYLFVIIGRRIDYLPLASFLGSSGPNGNWVYGWYTQLSYTLYQHQALTATDDAIYICNAQAVASILENAGSVFDPATSSTYTINPTALALPTNDYAQCIAQLGVYLLVGGILNFIYPWDRVSTSFNYPIICADTGIYRIASTNSNAYVFAGQRGRIYITNGQQIQLYKKIPDSLSGNPEPYYEWQDAVYLRNKLYFTMLAKTNTGTTLQTMGGIWALGIDNGQTVIQLPTAGSLYNTNQLSYGNYGGSCPVLIPLQIPTPSGYGLGAAWIDTASVGDPTGVDMPSTTPYTGGETYVDTDIVPVGTYFRKGTFAQLEYKLSKPLVSGENVQIYQRPDLASSFTEVPLSEGGNTAVSGAFRVNFEQNQWEQFRVVLTSTGSNPSYARLTEIILRK